MTLRLLSYAEDHWVAIDGWSVTNGGMDPLDLPIDRFLNFIYWFIVRDGDPEEIEKFDIRLWRPPPGEVPDRGPWSAESETASFKAFSSQIKGSDSISASTA